jgi:hypothetical protein
MFRRAAFSLQSCASLSQTASLKVPSQTLGRKGTKKGRRTRIEGLSMGVLRNTTFGQSNSPNPPAPEEPQIHHQNKFVNHTLPWRNALVHSEEQEGAHKAPQLEQQCLLHCRERAPQSHDS